MKVIPKTHWRVVDRTKDTLGRVVEFLCPDCDKRSSLWTLLGGHAISAEGEVSPSVVCPFRPCRYHEFVRLEGWSDGTREKVERVS